jgi:catechol 2,3-dioxygenase-like lactoylglutathione lyase family enzyme
MDVLAFHHVQVGCPEESEDALRAFYSALGFVEVAKPPVLAARGGFWMRAASGVELHVGREPTHRPSSKAHPALLVDDLAAATDALLATGAVIDADDGELRPSYARAQTRDPAGNRLELVQRVTPE